MYNKKVLQTAVKELDKAKAPAKRKDIITDPMGQWKYPGQVTRIPSDTITMQGVNYPVYGVPDYGQPVLMQPGQDYDFPGANYVDEYPQMQKGGAAIPTVEDAGSMNEDGIWVPNWDAIAEQAQKLNAKTVRTASGTIVNFDNNWQVKNVDDNPEMKRGGGLKSKKYTRNIEGTNRFFAESALFKKPKKLSKKRIFDPNAKYFQEGGELVCPPFHKYNSELNKCVAITEEEKAASGKKFMQDWVQSPRAKEMLQASVQKDNPNKDVIPLTKNVATLRRKLTEGKANVGSAENAFSVGYAEPRSLDDMIDKNNKVLSTTMYDPNLLTYRTTDLEDKPVPFASPVNFFTKGLPGNHAYVYPHEYSHNQDMAGDLIPKSDKELINKYKDVTNVPQNELYQKYAPNGKWTPESEKEYDKELAKAIKTDYPSRRSYQTDKKLYETNFNKYLKDNYLEGEYNNSVSYDEFVKSQLPDSFFVSEGGKPGRYGTIDQKLRYLTNPTETRARLNAVRMYGKEYGIYDPFTEKVTPETYQKLLEIHDQQNPNEVDANQLRQLKSVYTDEQILDMMNTISKNNNSDEELNVAANGGSTNDYIEADLTDEEIEEYAKGGFIIEDISIPQLTQAQKGITIADPKEYAYRKAAYDDSMYLYKNNLEPLPKITHNTYIGGKKGTLPYRSYTYSTQFKHDLDRAVMQKYGSKSSDQLVVANVYQGYDTKHPQISSPAFRKYHQSKDFTKIIPANKPIKVDIRKDYHHPQGVYNPFTGKYTGVFLPGQNEKDADVDIVSRARFKKPVQPVYFKKEGDKKSVQKSYNKVGSYNKNTNPNGWVSPPKKEQPYEKSRSTINKIPTVDPMGKRRIGETSNATIDPTTGNVTEVITPNYENLLPLKRLETERRNQIIESKVQQRKQSDYKTAYRDQTIVSYDPTIKQFIQTGSRKAPLPYSEKIGTKDWELNTSQEIPESGPLVFQVDGKDYYNEEEARKAQAFMPQGSYKFETGGEADDYMDLDLTEDEIQQYARGGFIIEELPEAQVGGSKYDPLIYSKPQVSESTRPNVIAQPNKNIIKQTVKQKTAERKIVADKIKNEPLLTKKQKTEILMSPKKLDEYAYLAYEKDLDTVKEVVPQSNSDRAWEYITNPFTAAEYAISGGGAENMPHNINEMRMAGIDPGVVQGRNLVGNALNMSTNLFDAGDKVVRNVGEGNYGDAALEALRFLPGSRLSTGLGKQLGIKSGLLSKVNKVNLDGLNDYEKLSSQLPGSPNNLKIINAPGVPKKPLPSQELIANTYQELLNNSGNALEARARLADKYGRESLELVDNPTGNIPETLMMDPSTRNDFANFMTAKRNSLQESLRNRQAEAMQIPAYERRQITNFGEQNIDTSSPIRHDLDLSDLFNEDFPTVNNNVNYISAADIARNFRRPAKINKKFKGIKNTLTGTLSSIDEGIGKIIDRSKMESLKQPIRPADIEADVNKLLDTGLGIKKGDVKIKVVNQPGGEVQVLLNPYEYFSKNKKLIEDTYGEGSYDNWMQGMDKDTWIDSGKLNLGSTFGEEINPRKFTEILRGKPLEQSTRFGIGRDLNLPAPGLKRSGDFPFANWNTDFRENVLDNLGISGELTQAYKKAAQNKGYEIYSGGTGHMQPGAKRYVRELLNDRVEIMNPNDAENLFRLLNDEAIMGEVNKALKNKNVPLPSSVQSAIQPLIFKYKRKGGATNDTVEKELSLEEIKHYIDNGYIIEEID